MVRGSLDFAGACISPERDDGGPARNRETEKDGSLFAAFDMPFYG